MREVATPTDEYRIAQPGELFPLEIEYTPSMERVWPRILEGKAGWIKRMRLTNRTWKGKVETPDLGRMRG